LSSQQKVLYISHAVHTLAAGSTVHHKQYTPSQQVVPQIKLVWFRHVCHKNTVLIHPVLLTDLLAPVRVRKEHCSSPPRPPTVSPCTNRPIIIYRFFSKICSVFFILHRKNSFGSGTCAIRTLFLLTPSFHQLVYWLRYVCEKNTVLSHPVLPLYYNNCKKCDFQNIIRTSLLPEPPPTKWPSCPPTSPPTLPLPPPALLQPCLRLATERIVTQNLV
jgi:hypothetical protein